MSTEPPQGEEPEKPGGPEAPGGPGGPGRPDDVGSVAEEAAKLFGALAGWASDQGTDWTHGLAGVAGAATEHVHGLARQFDEGIATGAPECRYCPICRTVHLVRELSPEVRDHLTSAASSLLQAATGILAAVAEQSGAGDGAGAPRSAGVERIDLDEPEADPGADPGADPATDGPPSP